MHESEAMEFVEAVLGAFFLRVYKIEPENLAPYLQEAREFIADASGYWVKEKALWVVSFAQQMETSIQAGIYSRPAKPEEALAAILQTAQKRVSGIVEHYRLAENPRMVQIFTPIPQNRELPGK